jgi:uncharacterized membrane protein YhaH (DUF805 family)
MKKLLKLYWISLKKMCTFRGRASRTEILNFHIFGLIPILFCLIFSMPAMRSLRAFAQEGKRLLSQEIEKLTLLSGQLETMPKIDKMAINDPTFKTLEQKFNEMLAVFCGHIPSLFLLLCSILIYLVSSFSVVIRRLHDMGLHGFFSIFYFIPDIHPLLWVKIAFLFLLVVVKGNGGPNAYGPKPFDS